MNGSYVEYNAENGGYLLLKVPVVIEADAAGDYTVTFELEPGDFSDAETGEGYDFVAEYFTATIKIAKAYTITWLDEDGTELGTTRVAEGETPEYDGDTPQKESDDPCLVYDFVGWDPEPTEAVEDAEYTAVYEEREIHEGAFVEQVDPTCTEEGTGSYYQCVNCGRVFGDRGCTQELGEVPVLDALGHDYDLGNASYEWAEDNSTVTATAVCTRDESHVLTETVNTVHTVTVDPVCEKDGEEQWVTEPFKQGFREQIRTGNVDALGHDWGEPALEGIRTFPDNVKGMWYYFEIIEASNDHGHKGQRPNETWVPKDFSTGYDIDYYERP